MPTSVSITTRMRGSSLIGVDRMIVTHGLANALGFVGCGLLAHLRLAAARPS
jgi:hypothetical protein